MMRSAFGPKAREFCSLVGVQVPIVQAPMAGGWTTPELVAAVSNAGGVGMLAATGLPLDQLRSLIAATRRLTDRPFGANFVVVPTEPLPGPADAVQATLDGLRAELNLPPSDSEVHLPPQVPLQDQIALLLDEQVPMISFAMFNPAPYVEQIHRAGALVFATATTVAEATALEVAGADVIVAQGAEAGGHRSTFQADYGQEIPLVGTMVLTPCVVDAVRKPVLASGGIMDGRGLAAALALGASGVQMGTRFLASAESNTFPDYRQRLKEAQEADTVITWHFTGRPARSIRNRFIEHLDAAQTPPLPWPYQRAAAGDIYRAAVTGNRGDYVPLLAGQGTRLARIGQHAGEIVAEVSAEAQEVLRQLVSKEGE